MCPHQAGHATQAPTLLATLLGRLLVVGYGAIGEGVLPLLLRHLAVAPSSISLLTAPDRGAQAAAAAKQHGLGGCHVVSLTPANYVAILDPLLAPGDFLLNLSVDVSSVALMQLCQAKRCLYLDTVVEPWAGGYTDTSLSVQQRSNYAQREAMLEVKRACEAQAAATGVRPMTALVTHGANPGLVSHLVKHALLDVASSMGRALPGGEPCTRAQWAALARDLGVKAIHIAERDSQTASQAKQPGEFVNTWSVDGFISEGCQPAELGWGTHEKGLPSDAHPHCSGSRCAIYLDRPGCATRVRSWCPGEGPFHGFLVTHNEAISLADWLTLTHETTGEVTYRPTVHYAYHPVRNALGASIAECC